jgi:uncharacterized damage-inducible protein DinB
MSLAQNYILLATYNQRMNRQLLTACHQLSTEQLEQDSGSFFPTILNYWNHLLFGDLILLGRLAANNIAALSSTDLSCFPLPRSPQDTYVKNLEELTFIRERLDQTIINFFEGLSEMDCQKVVTYHSTEGDLVTQEVAVICQHIFNHQTHHRGQLTCLLSQLGIDYGCTDFPVVIT